MAELVLGAVSLGVSVASLTLAFKGAVDSYLLIESFFDSHDDSGLRDLALSYHYECWRFEHWGDRNKILAQDSKDSAWFHQSDHVKALVAGLVQRVEQLLKEAKNYTEIHDAAPVLVSQKRHKSRFKWAIKNKAKFSTVVDRLQEHNSKLEELLDRQTKSSFEATLPGYILAPISSAEDLKSLQTLAGPGNAQVAHAARLKSLELATPGTGPGADVDFLDVSDFSFNDATPPTHASPSPRAIGIHKKTQRVWVEWRIIEEGVSEAQAGALVDRVRTLSAMLSADSATYLRTAQCIGVLEDPENSLRLGLVFQPPVNYGMAQPVSLLQIIEGTTLKPSEYMKEPPLGHKFALARALGSSIALIHAASWLHKAFRSDNILFFGDPRKADTLLDCRISGFENSREVTGESLGHRPTGSGPVDYFYHPDATEGFSKTMDLYSFGVVLLEIAYWRPLRSKIAKAKALGSLEVIRKLFVTSAKDHLPAMMGSVYADVVTKCLECALPNSSDDELACAVSVEVISKLDQCRA
ncbi:hypothetical protein OQA88_13058 [Cercophora sp. LCS_1]